MCNCSNISTTICNQCFQGNSCGCPPDYTILPAVAPCKCCPAGYTYVGPTPNYKDGSCVNGDITVLPIDCPSCAESVSSDCVILPSVECLGIVAGTTLTQFVNYLCSSSAFVQTILTRIGLDTNLGSGFCQLVQNCPASGGSAPILGPIVVTYP